MENHLILLLEAPTVSFGGESIDNFGVVRDFPTRAMLAGLLANALGYERHEGARLDALQARLVFASALVRPGMRMRDYQTARLFEKDAGWTTRGVVEGRAKSPSFDWDDDYEAARGERLKSLTHQRYRDLDADSLTLVALRLTGEGMQTLEDIATALERPARPLFLGRKPNLPSRPLLAGRVDANDPLEALASSFQRLPRLEKISATGPLRVQWGAGWVEGDAEWPNGQPMTRGNHILRITRRSDIVDERRNLTGVHAGQRRVIEGELSGWPPPSRKADQQNAHDAGQP